MDNTFPDPITALREVAAIVDTEVPEHTKGNRLRSVGYALEQLANVANATSEAINTRLETKDEEAVTQEVALLIGTFGDIIGKSVNTLSQFRFVKCVDALNLSPEEKSGLISEHLYLMHNAQGLQQHG